MSTSCNTSKLIIFTKYPRPGRVKTRFIPKLGETDATLLQKKMVSHTMNWARALCETKNISLEIRYDGAQRQEVKDWLGPDLDYAVQGNGNLGDRMARAFQDGFEKGASRIILAGTDIPQLNMPLIKMAFSSLKNRDMVIIPTKDGGYCLLGLRFMVPDLFKSMAWGMDSVFRITMQRAEENSLDAEVFAALRDVDTPADLCIWQRVQRKSISIVIPALNEEDSIAATLRQLISVPDCEIIVSDGGSRDKTPSIVRDLGIRLVRSDPGRGTQMNAGAAVASGDILLFLHADTLLPVNFSESVRRAMADPRVAGGAFGLKLRPMTPLLRIIEKTINWRTKYFALPYGDQAYFVRASLFRQMGGYENTPLMEDVEFLRRLRKWGKLALIPDPVESSSRLFIENGVIRTVLRNKVVIFGYKLGVAPKRLFQIYYRKKRWHTNQKNADK
jgi:rSAM/selenodomain-associated transferase 2/rSAM/selenodomain-associated transferase 1